MMSLIAAGTYSAGAFPAAQFCADLSIGGYTDWYLPSRYEMDIAYFNLKPSTQTNDTGWGTNIYSVPRRSKNNSLDYPMQTNLTAFNTASQAFVDLRHWASTETNANLGWFVNFSNGGQGYSLKESNNLNQVRAFRRIAL